MNTATGPQVGTLAAGQTTTIAFQPKPKITSKPIRRVYIAGPMSGYPEHNFPAFERAILHLKNRGYLPVSPHLIDPTHVGECRIGNGAKYRVGANGHMESCHLLADIKQLVHCDAIYMLKGWEASFGSELELTCAKRFGFPIYFEGIDGYDIPNLAGE